VTLALDGSFTYTPAANFNGTDSFTYTATDGTAVSNVATVTITVSAVNDAPVAVNDAATTPEDTAVSGTVLGNDTDVDAGTTLTASLGASPTNGTLTLASDGSFTYTPTVDFNGIDTFTYTVSDGIAVSNVATVTITITPVNDEPLAVGDGTTTLENTATTIAVLANDSDLEGDSLSVTAISAPAHGTAILSAPGTITYTPEANYCGPDSFTYTVADGYGGTATATISITITEANHTPEAADDARQVSEDMAAMIAVLANDTDEDGDPLSVTSVGTPAHGTAASIANGTIVYTPAANYSGADSFTYTVEDGHGGTDTATVTMTITAVNDAPVAASDSYITADDTLLTPATRVVANDSDLDNDSLTAVLVQAPSRGTLTLSADGSFTYTPAANANGVDTFTYKVNDGSVDSGPATVTITVTPVNDAPSADDRSVTAGSGVGTAIALGADDVDGDTLSYSVSAGPAHGVLTGLAPNLSYTSLPGYVGPDSFTFTAGDGVSNSSTATVQIDVRGLGRPPETESQWMIIDEDTPVEITLNAGDPEGDPLTFTIVSPPSHGTLSGTLPNVVYTPDPNYEGEDRFTFRANDGLNDSNAASVDLWVWGVNDAPVVSGLQFEVGADGSVVGQFQATDPEGDSLFFWVTSEPAHGSVTFDPMTGSFTYVANPGNPGQDSFTYTVYDWQTQGNEATVQIGAATGASGG
jgi:VCBS repeat-containing protein